MTTVVIPSRGQAESALFTRALINMASRGERTQCSDPSSATCGYPTTPANDAKQHASADTAPSSSNAEQQQTHETNAGTSGEAATTPAANRNEARKNRPFFE